MTRVYLAGPMSGIKDFNYPAFHAAASRWREAGWEIENPAEHFDGRTDLPYSTYMRAALESLLRCDAIALLSGWWDSPGARLEYQVAQALGMTVYYVGERPPETP